MKNWKKDSETCLKSLVLVLAVLLDLGMCLLLIWTLISKLF